MRKRIGKKPLYYLVLGAFAASALIPLAFVLVSSFFPPGELAKYYVDTDKGALSLVLIPKLATLENYLNTLIATPSYLMKFWISLAISLAIMAGQVILACFGGYGFAKFNFRFKKVFFYLIIILMMMPHQVSLVSNYIVLNKLGWIGTYYSLIVPGMFSMFGVFLLTQVFSSIPNDVIEAARIDGANHLTILFRVVVPYRKSGIIALAILNFIDNWNMVEQPLVFLKDRTMHPLSVFLSRVNEANLGLGFACGVLAALPVLFLFLFFKDDLAGGIEYSNLK